MKNIFMLLLLVVSSAFAATENDLVQAYLASSKIAWSSGDWHTCQPQGQADQVCSWNTAKLGAQPTQTQLNAMATYVTNQQQAAQYNGLLTAGVTITSTATAALNGTYALDSQTQCAVNSEVLSITVNGVFTNGQTTKPWPDASGAVHAFTTTQFKAFATAVSNYVDGLVTARATLLAGQSVAWPVSTATIP